MSPASSSVVETEPSRAHHVEAGAPVSRFASLPASTLLAGLFAFAGANHLLLWRFLDFADFWQYVAGLFLIAAMAFLVFRSWTAGGALRIELRTIIVCMAAAFILLVLGGEGRLFYANVDWQIRDAVLHDMARQSWPFVYTARGVPEVLRAPLAMYLLPALAYKAWGPLAGDIALLVQNSLFFGSLLAASSVLFNTARARWTALAVFVLFSGMDILGPLLDNLRGMGGNFDDHVELWSGLQYSSHVTQIFWVPQHAFAGWLCALLFLLWKADRLGVGALLAAVPLLTLWSPLSAIGAVPFAAYAGIRTLSQRRLGRNDVLLPIAALALSLPALIYLQAGGEGVGAGFYPVRPLQYAKFVAAEVLPIVGALLLIGWRQRFGLDTLFIVTLGLLVIPFFQIGPTIDFIMRASIPALMILSVMAADALLRAEDERGTMRGRAGGFLLCAALVIGAVTPILEVRRAIMLRPSPPTECNFVQAGDQSRGLVRTTRSTYLTPVGTLPSLMRPANPVVVRNYPNARCWSRPWKMPR